MRRTLSLPADARAGIRCDAGRTTLARVLGPHPVGVGWTLNLGRVARVLGLA